MPQDCPARLTEMSSSPASINRRISFRRTSGTRNSGCSEKSASSRSWYFDRRKKKFFSRIQSGFVRWIGQSPSMRSFSCLKASHETQYHPS